MRTLKIHLNAMHSCICMQQFVELIPRHTQRHITVWRLAEMILENDLFLWFFFVFCFFFNTLGQKTGSSSLTYFHVLADCEVFVILYECAAGVSSLSPASELPPMWIPEPWHRFLSLSGAAAAQAPSAWLISFILDATKEAHGDGKGSFNSGAVSA